MKIDKGIPLPKANRGGKNGELSTALLSMKKGDSVLVLGRQYNNVMRQASKYLGSGKYAVRSEGEGFRVWRTS